MKFKQRGRVINPVATLSSERPPVSGLRMHVAAGAAVARRARESACDINPINPDFADADRSTRSDDPCGKSGTEALDREKRERLEGMTYLR